MTTPLMPNVQSQIPYRVLARKYRPTSFDDLVGQEVLVRTLSNAIAQGRVAHAFLLTGIRGIGKTTTARIIARALNCEQGPTIHPCGLCSQCVGIAEDRNVDVLEMDAASHTGVGDIRELIDTVRYMPSAARYKIYIIDEVHMLSTSAFNALLKTLEEPPPHVKFIFATTELRKIPVTILSRCQRFDLKRLSTERLAEHLGHICAQEKVTADARALHVIAMAAEGSVRDGLSLLDQAIARGNPVTEADVRAMLGAVDQTALCVLLEQLLSGQVQPALTQLRNIYAGGMDPLVITQELMEWVHLVTRVKIDPGVAEDITLSEPMREHAQTFATRLSMPILARLWQMLLKGLSEIRVAHSAIAALEMLVIRIAYAADLPTPAELVKEGGQLTVGSGQKVIHKKEPDAPVVPRPLSTIHSFPELVALFEQKREALLHIALYEQAELVAFESGSVTLHMTSVPSRDFTARVAAHLKDWTGQDWQVMLSPQSGQPSLQAQAQQRGQVLQQEALQQPMVVQVMEAFPGAKIIAVQ